MFLRLVFICNTCFILAVCLRFYELSLKKSGNFDGAIGFHPLESTLVILGYGAIILNAIFVLVELFYFLKHRSFHKPGWIVWFNLLIFPVQCYYHFWAP